MTRFLFGLTSVTPPHGASLDHGEWGRQMQCGKSREHAAGFPCPMGEQHGSAWGPTRLFGARLTRANGGGLDSTVPGGIAGRVGRDALLAAFCRSRPPTHCEDHGPPKAPVLGESRPSGPAANVARAGRERDHVVEGQQHGAAHDSPRTRKAILIQEQKRAREEREFAVGRREAVGEAVRHGALRDARTEGAEACAREPPRARKDRKRAREERDSADGRREAASDAVRHGALRGACADWDEAHDLDAAAEDADEEHGYARRFGPFWDVLSRAGTALLDGDWHMVLASLTLAMGVWNRAAVCALIESLLATMADWWTRARTAGRELGAYWWWLAIHRSIELPPSCGAELWCSAHQLWGTVKDRDSIWSAIVSSTWRRGAWEPDYSAPVTAAQMHALGFSVVLPDGAWARPGIPLATRQPPEPALTAELVMLRGIGHWRKANPAALARCGRHGVGGHPGSLHILLSPWYHVRGWARRGQRDRPVYGNRPPQDSSSSSTTPSTARQEAMLRDMARSLAALQIQVGVLSTQLSHMQRQEAALPAGVIHAWSGAVAQVYRARQDAYFRHWRIPMAFVEGAVRCFQKAWRAYRLHRRVSAFGGALGHPGKVL